MLGRRAEGRCRLTRRTGPQSRAIGVPGLSGVLAGLALIPALAAAPAHAARGPLQAAPLTQAAGTAQDLRLGRPEPGPDGIRVLATVPSSLSGRELPEQAFTVRQGGLPVPVDVERLADGDAVQLVLGVDTSGSEADVQVLQAAAADLLRLMPPDLPTTVLPGSAQRPAAEAVADVGRLAPGPTGLLEGLPAADARRRWLVLLTGCPALERLPTAPSAGDVQVSVLTRGEECGQRAAALAAPGRGVVRTDLSLKELLVAVDEVAADLLGQYRLRVEADPARGPLDVLVSASGLVAQAPLPLPAPPGGAPAPAGPSAADPSPPPASAAGGSSSDVPRSGLPRTPVVLAVALIALGVGGLLAVLVRPPQAPGPVGGRAGGG